MRGRVVLGQFLVVPVEIRQPALDLRRQQVGCWGLGRLRGQLPPGAAGRSSSLRWAAISTAARCLQPRPTGQEQAPAMRMPLLGRAADLQALDIGIGPGALGGRGDDRAALGDLQILHPPALFVGAAGGQRPGGKIRLMSPSRMAREGSMSGAMGTICIYRGCVGGSSREQWGSLRRFIPPRLAAGCLSLNKEYEAPDLS